MNTSATALPAIGLGDARRASRNRRRFAIGRKPLAIAALLLVALALAVKFAPGGGNGNAFNGGADDPSSNKPDSAQGGGSGEERDPAANRDPWMRDETVVGRGRTGPDLRISNSYPKDKPAVIEAKAPQYALPLDPALIANAKQERVAKLLANEGAAAMLKRNGFVISGEPIGDEFGRAYKQLEHARVPLVVTPDVVLHLFHICFDETLKDLEEQVLAWDMLEVTKSLLDSQIAQYEDAKSRGEAQLAAALKLNVAYLSVAHKLLGEMPRERKPEEKPYEGEDDDDPDALKYETGRIVESGAESIEVHADVRELVAQELACMDKHEGFKVSPIFGYMEDYSQYLPRGHYSRSELLKKYFCALMWYGRLSFLLHEIPKRGPVKTTVPVTPEMAENMTISAALLAHDVESLPNAEKRKRPDFAAALEGAERNTVKRMWERVYAATSFFVGAADDLTPAEYAGALRGASSEKPSALVSADVLAKFQQGLESLPTPRVYSGTAALIFDGAYGTPSLREALWRTQGFRLMGQRFIPDSEAMGRLVFPTVKQPLAGDKGATESNLTYVMGPGGPMRGFPRGLDVMRLLGSQRAGEILTELKDDAYAGYAESIAALQQEWDGLSHSDWNQNLYYGWLYALRPLLEGADKRKGFPTYMQTKAYEDRLLTSACASWAQLRHDTILYAKQSYTGGGAGVPPRIVGFVEPLPEFYGRMVNLCAMMQIGLKDLGVAAPNALGRLEKLIEMSSRLVRISRDELAGKELDDKDYGWIKNFAKIISYTLEPSTGQLDPRALRTDIVADVHTDQNSEQCLEEGTGKLRMGAFAFVNPEGKVLVGFGPVLSYYEFRRDMKDRLTDEAWQAMLESGKTPTDPEWVKNFTAK